MIKRILSVILCAVIMCTGIIGVTASAIDVNESIQAPDIYLNPLPTKLSTTSTYYVTSADEFSFKLQLPVTQKEGTIYYWHTGMDKYTKYTEPVTLKENSTIKFYTYKNKQRSVIKTFKVKFVTKAFPILNDAGMATMTSATYKEGFEITLGGFREGSRVYYTLDGTKATVKSTKYKAGDTVKITSDTTLYVVAYHPDYTCIRSKYVYKIDANAEDAKRVPYGMGGD